MNKPLKNGHAPEPEAEAENATTVRTRRARSRKSRGAVCLMPIEVQPDMIAALIRCGWLHESEAQNRDAVTAAIGACVFHSLSAGMTPSSTKAALQIDLRAVQHATPWLKPGTQLNASTAAIALQNAVHCARIVGFGPEEFSERLRQMAAID